MKLFGVNVSFEPANALEVVSRISIFEMLSLLGIVVAVVSLVLSVRANMDQSSTRAAQFSFQVWERFRADDVQTAYLDIEWRRFQYPVANTRNGFATDEQERRTDRLLSLLDDIASLAVRGVITKVDLDRWSYIFVRVFDDPSVQRYMEFLIDFYRRNGVRSGPHLLAWKWYKGINRSK